MSQNETRHLEAELARAHLDEIKEMVRNELLAILSQARAMSITLPPECREKLMEDLSAQIHPDGRNDIISESFFGAYAWCDAELETQPKELPMTPSAPI